MIVVVGVVVGETEVVAGDVWLGADQQRQGRQWIP